MFNNLKKMLGNIKKTIGKVKKLWEILNILENFENNIISGNLGKMLDSNISQKF